MRSALVGWSGFIGRNLLRARPFDRIYNSQNIASIRNQYFDFVVCAAGRADSHRINQQGPRDFAELEALANTLRSVKIGKLVHISTVCVYEPHCPADETAIINPAKLSPYGRNRYWLERALCENFDTLVLRLPQLYGTGMKKGVIFDLICGHRVEYISPDDCLQHYDLSRLWADTKAAIAADLSVLNLATPPLKNKLIAEKLFNKNLTKNLNTQSAIVNSDYTRDMRTCHAGLFGQKGYYILSTEEEMAGLASFIAAAQRGGLNVRSRGQA